MTDVQRATSDSPLRFAWPVAAGGYSWRRDLRLWTEKASGSTSGPSAGCAGPARTTSGGVSGVTLTWNLSCTTGGAPGASCG